MIQISNLTKTYDNGENKLYALNNVSFEIADKEFVVILGASGSGKSTLMNAVSGLEIPDSGSIKYDGQEICGLSQKQLTEFRRKKTAFVFQAYYLLPALNVEANIRMGAGLGGLKELSEIINSLGLAGKERKLLTSLAVESSREFLLLEPWLRDHRCYFATSLRVRWTKQPVGKY